MRGSPPLVIEKIWWPGAKPPKHQGSATMLGMSLWDFELVGVLAFFAVVYYPELWNHSPFAQ